MEETSILKVVLLQKDSDMQTVLLPSKREGRYSFFTQHLGKKKPILQIDGLEGKWIASCLEDSNYKVGDQIVGKKLHLKEEATVIVEAYGEEYVLYVEEDNRENSLIPYYLEPHNSIIIGRSESCDICYPNPRVSGTHAELFWVDDKWYVRDLNSRNGVYLNEHRVNEQQLLRVGDIIYIMGLYVVIGVGFIAMNNVDRRARINNPKIREIKDETDVYYSKDFVEVDDTPFDRVVRSAVDLSAPEITVEAPPMKMGSQNNPLLLRMGNPLLSGAQAAMTGNVFSLATSMLLPAVTQGISEKERKEYEEKRTAVYGEYLRKVEKRIEQEIAREERQLNYLYPHLEKTLSFVERKERLWERRKYDADFLSVRMGAGDIPMKAKLVYPHRRIMLDEDSLLEDMYRLVEQPMFLREAPVMVDLKENFVLGVSGLRKTQIKILRNMILSLAVTHSFDEVKMIVLAGKEERQQLGFVKYLPHNWDDNKTIRFYCENMSDVQQLNKFLLKEREDREELHRNKGKRDENFVSYVVFATDKELYEGIELFKDIQENDKYDGISIVAAYDGVPKECKKIIEAGVNQKCRLVDLYTPGEAEIPFELDSCDSGYEMKCMREVMHTKLNIEGMKYALPTSISFLELFKVGRVEHLNPLKRWKENNPIKSLATPLGIGGDGKPFMLDLHEKFHGPHGLIAGGTGSGKSEFIITFILSMAVNYGPDEVAFILIDYKGGGLADAFVNEKNGVHLPHVVGTITNLDGSAISRSLLSINSELKRRQNLFKLAKQDTDEGTMDIYDYQKMYRNGQVSEPLPHLFIISDEFAELKKQQPEFMDELISTARIGRSLGVHLILATQKPAGVVNDQIWSNSKFKICLRVSEKQDSQEMLKRPDAAEIKNTGRFYLQVGYNEIFAMGQSAWCGADYVPQDEVYEEVDQSVSFLDNSGQTIVVSRPRKKKVEAEGKQVVSIVKYLSNVAKQEGIVPEQLWCDPLPAVLDYDQLKEEVDLNNSNKMEFLVGRFDDPEKQMQYPFVMDALDFRSLMIVGGGGSGKSTLIRTMLYSMVEKYTPEEFNYYIVDLPGGGLSAFSMLPHCGAYLTEENDEGVIRLLKLVREIITKRKTLFAEADVTNYESYIKYKKLPLIYIIFDGFSNINSLQKGQDIYSEMYEYVRETGPYGMRMIFSVNHLNELHSRTRQEIESRIVLKAKDKYEVRDILEKKTEIVAPELEGRGMFCLEERVLEFHTSMLDSEENEQERMRLLKERLKKIVDRDGELRAEDILPMANKYETYEEFCAEYKKGVIPLGYYQKEMRKVAIPLKQLGCMSLYFGNPNGVRPIFDNILFTAKKNEMDVWIVKSSGDSVFSECGKDSEVLSENLTYFESSIEGFYLLKSKFEEEIVARNGYRDEYCEQNGIPRTDSNRIQKAYRYICERTKPILILFEALGDLYLLEDTEERKIIEQTFSQSYFKRIKGYNIYFVAGFYPKDSGFSSKPMIQNFSNEQFSLLFGGKYDVQSIVRPNYSELQRRSKVEKDYDHFIMKYRDELYSMRMPCGELVSNYGDSDDASII